MGKGDGRGEGRPKEGRGAAEVLFEYRPARFGPMTVALAFILALAAPITAVDRALAGRLDQAALAAIPLGALFVFGFLASPSPMRIGADSIEVSRSRFARVLGARTRFPLAEVDNIYPSFYEDAGMRFSPFASAEGTAKHAGLRIETSSGEKVVVPFTPTVLNLRKHGTPPYHAALEAVGRACADAGRPLVTKPPAYSKEKVGEMLVEAARPLMPFPVTVAGIFAPALLIPALGLAASQLFGPVGPEAVLLLSLAGLTPLFAVFVFVNVRGGRRARILHEVQKFRQHEKERELKPAPPA